MKIWPIIILLFLTCCPNSTLICKLDTVYRLCLMGKPVYGNVTYCIKQNGKSNHSVMSFITVENHPYTKFGIKNPET